MLSNDIFAEEAAVQADLELQENLLWSKAELASRLVEASISRDAELLDTLRFESMYEFCEFFYLFKARKMETPGHIEQLADIHNLHIDALLRDESKRRRLRLTESRLLSAIFTGDTLPRLVEVWRNRPGQIDQSNLARFLVTIMSTETCRKLVVAATDAGFLERAKSPYGTILVSSTGIMEQIFGSILRDLRYRIASIGREVNVG